MLERKRKIKGPLLSPVQGSRIRVWRIRSALDRGLANEIVG